MPDQVKTEGSTRLLNRDAPIHKTLHLAADADKMVEPTYLFESIKMVGERGHFFISKVMEHMR
jgi:hypothetical protein